MTPKERAVMQQALEAGSIDSEDVIETVWAAFAAAEQAEQEPVYWANPHDLERLAIDMKVRACGCPLYTVPLYAAPVRTKDPCHPWQDLTDDEIEAIFEYWYSQPETEVWSTVDLVRAVIEKFKEKNK